MIRVARELRIFPLVDVNAVSSPYLEPITKELVGKGCRVTVEKVEYEFQKGGNKMLRIIGE